MSVDYLADKMAIRELNETFAIAAMRKDLDKWAGTWIEDSVWNLPVFEAPLRGKANIVQLMGGRFPLVNLLSLVVCGAEIEVEGDRAQGKVYHQEIIFPNPEGPRKFIMGCYHDVYVKENGRWYYASRDYEVFGRA